MRVFPVADSSAAGSASAAPVVRCSLSFTGSKLELYRALLLTKCEFECC